VTDWPQRTATFEARPDRAVWCDTGRGWTACVIIVACAIAYSFRFTSFLHAKEAVLCIGLGVISILVALRGRFSWRGIAAFLPLWLWVGAGLCRLCFAPPQVPSDAAVELGRWLLLLLTVGLVFDVLGNDTWRRRVMNAFLLSTVVVGLLGLVQYAGAVPLLFPVFEGYTQRVYSVFGNQDLYGGYLAIGVPLLAHRLLASKRLDAASLTGLCVLTPALLVSGSRSAWLAAAVGVAVAVVMTERNRARLALFGALIAALAVVAAFAAPDATVRRITQTFRDEDEGRHARLFFWEVAWGLFEDAPLLGHGAGAYAYWSPRYLGELVEAEPGPLKFDVERHADHPHCEPLRILAETGLVGILFWLWLAARLLRRRGIEWAGLAAFAVFACFNGPLDSAPHLLAALLLAAMLSARRQEDTAEAWPSAYALPALCIALCAFEVWAVLVPSYLLRAAQDAQLAGEPALGLYERALRHPWPNAEAHRDYAIALAEDGRVDDAYGHFQEALDGLDTSDLYLALAALAIERGDRDAARRWAQECLRRCPRHPEATDLLAHVGGDWP